MPIIFIKLKNRSDTVYFQALMGTYSNLAWVRTEDPESGITRVITTEDLLEETREVLRAIGEEVEFEEVETDAQHEN